MVVGDTIANSGAVVTSYFEWLRNMTDRFRYEAEVIRHEEFDPSLMDRYIMPEFRSRISAILGVGESEETTRWWNSVLRDIVVAAVNEDYAEAKTHGVSMQTASLADAIMRVVSAVLVTEHQSERMADWDSLPVGLKERLLVCLAHPESHILKKDAEEIVQLLKSRIST